MNNIVIEGAQEGNLNNLSVEIPRNRLTVMTGVSGSGKSTLAVKVLYQECQRQYLEAMNYQGIVKPEVKRIRGASPAVLITQNDYNRNPRSTVGTVTDIYTDLRMIYEKLSDRDCPYCHARIRADACREETEKKGEDFKVYMYCSECGRRMDKLTRSSYSYNTTQGACPVCQGMGNVLEIFQEQVIHEDRSLEDGAVDYWEHRYGEYQIQIIYKAFEHYGIPVPKKTPVGCFTDEQKRLLLYGTEDEQVRNAFPSVVPQKKTMDGRVEGVFPILRRRYQEQGNESGRLNRYFGRQCCPACNGERLAEPARNASIGGLRLPMLSCMTMKELLKWAGALERECTERQMQLVSSYILDLQTKAERIAGAGLSYLTLDRQTATLSGGEAQRLKMAALLDSEVSGIIYILDEPTAGLHSRDTAGVVDILKKLRDLDNTVLVIEHDPDIMREADYIIDIGPGAGKYGGTVSGKGSWKELIRQKDSTTGRWFMEKKSYRTVFRCGDGGCLTVRGACRHNLKNVDVILPTGCLVSVTGVSGSGKSTLVFDVLEQAYMNESRSEVDGLQHFARVVSVHQQSLTRMRRSNTATYCGVYDRIRRIFAGLKQAKEEGLTAGAFSFNSQGGRCDNCDGLGYVVSNMLFFADQEVVCPVCSGQQFKEPVLKVTYRGHSIHDVLQLEVDEAAQIFYEFKDVMKILNLLKEVGLGYLKLGQSLTTLSGGECQRLKLAAELTDPGAGRVLYLMDEPTAGLHPYDVEYFIALLDRLVDAGNTVIVVEHNLTLIRESDWVADLGPGGGADGGQLIAAGTPLQIMSSTESETGRALQRFCRVGETNDKDSVL